MTFHCAYWVKRTGNLLFLETIHQVDISNIYYKVDTLYRHLKVVGHIHKAWISDIRISKKIPLQNIQLNDSRWLVAICTSNSEARCSACVVGVGEAFIILMRFFCNIQCCHLSIFFIILNHGEKSDKRHKKAIKCFNIQPGTKFEGYRATTSRLARSTEAALRCRSLSSKRTWVQVEIGEVLFQGKCGSKATGTSEIWLKLVLTSWFLICHATIFSVYNLGSLLLFVGECWGMNFGCNNSCLWTMATESSESSEISAWTILVRLVWLNLGFRMETLSEACKVDGGVFCV